MSRSIQAHELHVLILNCFSGQVRTAEEVTPETRTENRAALHDEDARRRAFTKLELYLANERKITEKAISGIADELKKEAAYIQNEDMLVGWVSRNGFSHFNDILHLPHTFFVERNKYTAQKELEAFRLTARSITLGLWEEMKFFCTGVKNFEHNGAVLKTRNKPCIRREVFAKLISSPTNDGFTLLNQAVYTGDMEIIKRVFEDFEEFAPEKLATVIPATSKSGFSVLHQAIFTGNLEIVKMVFGKVFDNPDILLEDKKKMLTSITSFNSDLLAMASFSIDRAVMNKLRRNSGKILDAVTDAFEKTFAADATEELQKLWHRKKPGTSITACENFGKISGEGRRVNPKTASLLGLGRGVT